MEQCHPLSRWIFVPALTLYRNTLTDILGGVLGHLLDYSKSDHIDNDDQPSQPYSKTMPSMWQALVNCVLEIRWMYTEKGLGNNLSLL